MAHGLGDTGAGWMMLASNWRRRGLFEEVSFIFPNAPSIPITVNFGMSMPGWYDIATLSVTASQEEFLRQQDEPGILKSRDYFNSLIQAELDKGIKPGRIVLGGFSQGGAMALITGLTSKEKLAGIFALSCYLPLSHKFKELVPDGFPNLKTPVFMAHGDADAVVKFEFGQNSAKHLEDMGVDVKFREYSGMGHTSDPLEIQDLENYLADVLPAEEKVSSSGL
ncbi:hypothetical protein LOZ55_003821 [Ophidiomyces ophidiicola]|nr:hypothetical protein LOZ55_003821 [Ophidiomyces ophidiicola]